MEQPEFTAQNLIESAGLKWVDQIETTNVPENHSADNTLVFIHEHDTTPTNHANDRFTSLYLGVQVQLFFASDFDQNILDCRLQIQRLFESAGWSVTRSEPKSFDPDTGQVYYTIIFNRKGLIK